MSLKCRTPEEAAGIEVKGEAHNNSKRKSQILRLTQHCYMDSAQFVNASWKWLVDSAGSIFFLIIGFLLTLLTAKFTADYSWKGQKADERRERVYAPLYDELSNIRTQLDPYGPFTHPEYDQIRSVHLLYLVPNDLCKKIVTVYDKLTTIDLTKSRLVNKYERKILEMMNSEFKDPVSDDSSAIRLARDFAIWAFQGEIPDELEESTESAFQGLNSRFTKISQTTSKEFLSKFLDSMPKDEDQIALNGLKQETLTLIDSIRDSVKGDLEKRF
jgi:hypothetical protein